MTNVLMYSTRWCGFCARAKQLLQAKGVRFQEIDVGTDPALRREMMERSGRRTVPQIWIENEHIGGCDDLYALERSGQLDQKLKGGSAS